MRRLEHRGGTNYLPRNPFGVQKRCIGMNLRIEQRKIYEAIRDLKEKKVRAIWDYDPEIEWNPDTLLTWIELNRVSEPVPCKRVPNLEVGYKMRRIPMDQINHRFNYRCPVCGVPKPRTESCAVCKTVWENYQ